MRRSAKLLCALGWGAAVTSGAALGVGSGISVPEEGVEGCSGVGAGISVSDAAAIAGTSAAAVINPKAPINIKTARRAETVFLILSSAV